MSKNESKIIKLPLRSVWEAPVEALSQWLPSQSGWRGCDLRTKRWCGSRVPQSYRWCLFWAILRMHMSNAITPGGTNYSSKVLASHGLDIRTGKKAF